MKGWSLKEIPILSIIVLNWMKKIGSLFRQIMTEMYQIQFMILEEFLLKTDWEREVIFILKNSNYWMILCSNGLLSILPQSWQLLWSLQVVITIQQYGMDTTPHPLSHKNDFIRIIKLLIIYKLIKNDIGRIRTCAGEPNGFQVHRLNHSATISYR